MTQKYTANKSSKIQTPDSITVKTQTIFQGVRGNVIYFLHEVTTEHRIVKKQVLHKKEGDSRNK